ncbi:MAG: hypothetical protein H0X31_04515 [Nostocaceae cyanobacterium]|nr:hypothetical protein [Nostocaceae cyanobacterium]
MPLHIQHLYLPVLPTYSLVQVDRTQSVEVQHPNHFELQGNHTYITYSATSQTGEAQLIYKDRFRSRNFSGQEIRLLDTEIGTQITVVLDTIPDAETLTLTLLLPNINLSGGNNRSKVQTEAILTTHRDNIGGPNLVQGQVETYKTLRLQGTASLVNF